MSTNNDHTKPTNRQQRRYKPPVRSLNANRNRTELRYRAVAPSTRRKLADLSTKTEDQELPASDRQQLISAARELQRNFTPAGFVIRKHLQYIASYVFQCRIKGHDDYADQVEKHISRWSGRRHCHVARRHNFSKLLKLIETHRVVDGDVGLLLCKNGQIQLIESDRIRTPDGCVDWVPDENGMYWSNGVKINRYGQSVSYGVSRRRWNGGGFENEAVISAEKMLLTGYTNRNDQVRGVSLLAPAINNFVDLEDNITFALAKMKVSQLLGFATFRANPEDKKFGPEPAYSRVPPDMMPHGPEDEFDPPSSSPVPTPPSTCFPNYSGASAPLGDTDAIDRVLEERYGPAVLHLDMEETDKAQLLESSTPSTQFKDFCIETIRLAFAALDIPYSFYDGSIMNYFGGKGELDGYIDSCAEKQEESIELLDEITEFSLIWGIENGQLPPPPPGLTLFDVFEGCEWRGAGLPYWRLIDDSKGYLVAIQGGLANPIDVCAAHKGSDFYTNIDKTNDAIQYARSKGVILPYDPDSPIKQNIGT